MIDLLRRYMHVLAEDTVDVAGVVALVGRIIQDPGVPMSAEIAPNSPLFAAAKLGRYRESGLPFVLTLEPAADERPTLAALTAAFGRCKRVSSGRGMPAVCIIDVAASGPAWTIALIATLSDKDERDDRNFATSIALRRDPVTAGDPASRPLDCLAS
jgi:hypothetical protein